MVRTPGVDVVVAVEVVNVVVTGDADEVDVAVTVAVEVVAACVLVEVLPCETCATITAQPAARSEQWSRQTVHTSATCL